jgi:hypothetical protein
MAAVASFLDCVTAFAESRTNLLRNTKVLSLDAHALKANGMPAHAELRKLFFVAFSTFVGENH